MAHGFGASARDDEHLCRFRIGSGGPGLMPLLKTTCGKMLALFAQLGKSGKIPKRAVRSRIFRRGSARCRSARKLRSSRRSLD